MDTWRELISQEMEDVGDSWGWFLSMSWNTEARAFLNDDNRVNITKADDQDDRLAEVEEVLDREFDGGWGGTEGNSFLLWTKTRVYFPVCYDGSESVGSVPRDPGIESELDHFGGG